MSFHFASTILTPTWSGLFPLLVVSPEYGALTWEGDALAGWFWGCSSPSDLPANFLDRTTNGDSVDIPGLADIVRLATTLSMDTFWLCGAFPVLKSFSVPIISLCFLLHRY